MTISDNFFLSKKRANPKLHKYFVQAFTNVNVVPLKLKVKWKNCLHIIRNFRFNFSHIYREENICADRLANANFLLPLMGSITIADRFYNTLGEIVEEW
jgi:hypothetical protein